MRARSWLPALYGVRDHLATALRTKAINSALPLTLDGISFPHRKVKHESWTCGESHFHHVERHKPNAFVLQDLTTLNDRLRERAQKKQWADRHLGQLGGYETDRCMYVYAGNNGSSAGHCIRDVGRSGWKSYFNGSS